MKAANYQRISYLCMYVHNLSRRERWCHQLFWSLLLQTKNPHNILRDHINKGKLASSQNMGYFGNIIWKRHFAFNILWPKHSYMDVHRTFWVAVTLFIWSLYSIWLDRKSYLSYPGKKRQNFLSKCTRELDGRRRRLFFSHWSLSPTVTGYYSNSLWRRLFVD